MNRHVPHRFAAIVESHVSAPQVCDRVPRVRSVPEEQMVHELDTVVITRDLTERTEDTRFEA